MTDRNPRAPDSPDSDFTNNWPSNLEFSEYLNFEDDQWPDDNLVSGHVLGQNNQTNQVDHFGGSGTHFEESSSRDVINELEKEVRDRVAFKTKTEVEILDDGFKWRKYGKKMVKNSPNPRNYYRCSVDGCQVKKRVERDKDDPSFVGHSHRTSSNYHHCMCSYEACRQYQRLRYEDQIEEHDKGFWKVNKGRHNCEEDTTKKWVYFVLELACELQATVLSVFHPEFQVSWESKSPKFPKSSKIPVFPKLLHLS